MNKQKMSWYVEQTLGTLYLFFQAGIPAKRLMLALEPETASIFCQYLPTEKLHGADETFVVSAEGTRYMVADLGGILAVVVLDLHIALLFVL